MGSRRHRTIRIYRYRIPLGRPLLLQGTQVNARHGLILRLTQGTSERFGEIAPLPGFSRESLRDAEMDLCRAASQWRAGEQPSPRFPSTQFGVDCTRLASPGSLPSCPYIPLLSGSPEAVLSQLGELDTVSPPRLIKLKVARLELNVEIDLVWQILRDYPHLRLRLDANRGWGWRQALQFATAVPTRAIDYIEEPLGNPDLLPEWFAHGGLPYALDETLQRPDYRFQMQPGLKALVIKPMLIGGWHRIVKLLKAARDAGIIAVISSSYESSLGLRHLAILARRWTPTQPPGLDTHSALCQDLLWPWPDSLACKPVMTLEQLQLIDEQVETG